MKRVIVTMFLVMGLAGIATMVALDEYASAHTPQGGASCQQGAWASGTRYDPRDNNWLIVSVDGVKQTKKFDTEGYLAVPIPADGQTHHYTWAVWTSNDNPAFKAHGQGDISCGETPPTSTPPTTTPPTTKKASFRVVRYCNTVRVEGRHNVAHITKKHPKPRKYIFLATARDNAVFANGSDHVRKVAWTKKHCHSGS